MTSSNRTVFSSYGLSVWDFVLDRIDHTPHRHNEIEINLLQRGTLTYVLGGQQVTIEEGAIGAFWAAIPHQAIHCPLQTHIYWATVPLAYVLQWDLPSTFLRSLLSGKLFQSETLPYSPVFFDQWVDDIAQERRTLALAEIHMMMQRLSLTASSPDAPTPLTAHMVIDKRANTMAQYMSQYFRESLTVATIAEQVGLHPNYAMSIFKDIFGITLIEYLTQQRIAHAQQLLITTDDNVTDIALDSGFQTLSHFYKAFKRFCGTTPGKYRAHLRH